MILAALQPLVPALPLAVADQAGPLTRGGGPAHKISEPGPVQPLADFSVREKHPSYPIVTIGI